MKTQHTVLATLVSFAVAAISLMVVIVMAIFDYAFTVPAILLIISLLGTIIFTAITEAQMGGNDD